MRVCVFEQWSISARHVTTPSALIFSGPAVSFGSRSTSRWRGAGCALVSKKCWSFHIQGTAAFHFCLKCCCRQRVLQLHNPSKYEQLQNLSKFKQVIGNTIGRVRTIVTTKCFHYEVHYEVPIVITKCSHNSLQSAFTTKYTMKYL